MVRCVKKKAMEEEDGREFKGQRFQEKPPTTRIQSMLRLLGEFFFPSFTFFH